MADTEAEKTGLGCFKHRLNCSRKLRSQPSEGFQARNRDTTKPQNQRRVARLGARTMQVSNELVTYLRE
jgi:hypothetical protein